MMAPIRLRILEGNEAALADLKQRLGSLGYDAQPVADTAHGAPEWLLTPAAGTASPPPDAPSLLEAVLNQVDGPVLACTADGTLTLANPAAQALINSSAEPQTVAQWHRRFPLFRPDGHSPLSFEELPLVRALNGEAASVQRVVAYGPDGEARTFRARARSVPGPGSERNGAVMAMTELTDQLRSKQGLRRQRDLYAALSEVNQFVVLQDPPPEAIFDAVCRIAVEYGGLQLAWVGLPDETGWVQPQAAYGEASDYLDELAISVDPQRPESRGPTGTAMREDRHVVEPAILTDPQMSPWHAAARAAGLRSSASFPIHRGGEVAASLNVYASEPDFFTPDLIHLLDEMVLDIAFALDNHDREAEHRRLVEIIEATPDFVGLADLEGTILYHNPAARDILGQAQAGGRIADFHAAESLARVWHEALPTAREHGVWRGETEILNTGGEAVPFSQTIIAHRDHNGTLTHYSTIARDISHQRRAEAEIRRLAYRDAVTGLANRASLLERLDQEISRAQRQGAFGALLYLDLDEFKAINDSLGHPAGDALLQALGDRLQEVLRREDIVARVGGDEFVALISDLGPDAESAAVQAEQAAEKLLGALGQPFVLDDHRLFVTASLGLTLFPEAGADRDTLLQQADAAMYSAKGEGPGNLRFFHQEMLTAVRRRLDLEQDLRAALERGELALHYQPLISLADASVIGLEALLRWHHPLRGAISPAEFIPVAEQSGLILEVGDWVIDEALDQLRRWQAEGRYPGPLGLGINISPRQFAHPDFVDRVAGALKRAQVPGDWIKLEITEHLLIQHMTTAVERMEALRELGLSFAVDDFGTGYSSLAYLHRLPVTTLKIDRSLVGEVTESNNSAVIVEAVLAMADRLELAAVAEGVETGEQAAFLAARGCTTGQGFLWDWARPADQVRGRLPGLKAPQGGGNGLG
jgi:diguanylate cyclase (GGDEF)-like protein/PAS domain S-box-containing protein